MITPIQLTDFKTRKFAHVSSARQHDNKFISNTGLQQNYYVNFTAKQKNSKMSDDLYYQYDNVAVDIENKAIALAKKHNHSEASHFHFISVAYDDILKYIDDLEQENADLHSLVDGTAPSYFISVFSEKLFEDPRYRNAFKQIITDEKTKVDTILEQMPKAPFSVKKMKVSELFYNDVDNAKEQLDRSKSITNGYDMYNGAFLSLLPGLKEHNEEIHLRISDLLMLEDRKLEERLYFPNYDQKAKNIIKNLNLGTNVYVTYDDTKVNPDHFVPSIIKAFEESDGKLNPKNTEIVEFNSNVRMDDLTDKLIELQKDKNKNYIVIFSEASILKNASKMIDGIPAAVGFTKSYVNFLEKTPKNLRIVMFNSKNNYLNMSQIPTLGRAYSEFGEITLPVLTSKDVLQALKEKPKMLEKVLEKYPKKSLEKVVEASSQMNGMFPDKTINLIKKISANYVDKKEITTKDIEVYIKDVDHLFKQSNKDSSIESVFDTGKRLKDIVGKTNTKKEADHIVKQIKNNKIGTKGFIIYNQDGVVGGGRRHTAEAIAGEANVPFVSINTMDFGTKDVDLFGGMSMTPEASIKKLFSLVSAQAETNPHRGAVLFVENFEYFSVGELVSQYHQKAMAQLIREMENAEKKGLNIVVMGSVSDSDLIGEAAMKSFKFNDQIEVSSTAFNEFERYDVLKSTFKKNKIKMAGTVEEQDKLLHDMSKTLRGFSFLELKSFVKKAESIAQERGNKEVTKSDMIESFLRITTGRPALDYEFPHDKEITAKHEAGHAVTLQIMNDLMKKSGKPWHIPDTVNFITLDPRGSYGGATYIKKDKNYQSSFENNFTDLVCSYGGYSAENYFYDMDGSYGISGDLQHITDMAKAMITVMGQGHHTGKISLIQDYHRGNVGRVTRENIDKDVLVITKNALNVSNSIVDAYSGFIDEFAAKYTHLVGTGDCLIDGDVFRKELYDWVSRQPKDKQAELELLDTMILEAIKASKAGKIY